MKYWRLAHMCHVSYVSFNVGQHQAAVTEQWGGSNNREEGQRSQVPPCALTSKYLSIFFNNRHWGQWKKQDRGSRAIQWKHVKDVCCRSWSGVESPVDASVDNADVWKPHNHNLGLSIQTNENILSLHASKMLDILLDWCSFFLMSH